VYHAAASAGLNPELERPGLLLPERPLVGAFYEDGTRPSDQDESNQRRPADVYIPRWRGGPASAWDFAVTSGLRDDIVALSARDPEAAVVRYEDYKCSYKDTKQQCVDQGFTFTPVILEATGGKWGPQARKIWSELAKATALASGELTTGSTCGVQLQQRLGMALQKENARALLRRFSHGVACNGEASLAGVLAEDACTHGDVEM
jgi:hypothetical protein